jgi:putative transposase
MTLFGKKYRVESIRLKKWDYRSSNAYFVTICTKYHERFLGRISGNSMILSDIGIIADQNIREIPNHFPHAILDEFVVMPNHVHLILLMDQNKLPTNDIGKTEKFGTDFGSVETQNFASLQKCDHPLCTPPLCDQPQCRQPLCDHPLCDQPIWDQPLCDQTEPGQQPPPSIFDQEYRIANFFDYQPNKFGPQSKNLGSIIRGYKSSVKKWATLHKINFWWEPRFYESIINDEAGLDHIRKYIINNPGKWNADRFHNQ